MPLFVAQHRHSPATCPAGTMGDQLLSHVSAANAARYGMTIQAEAVLDGTHGLLLIVRAPDRGCVVAFMDFFADLGDVQILPASSADEAVVRGGCGVQFSTRVPGHEHDQRTNNGAKKSNVTTEASE